MNKFCSCTFSNEIGLYFRRIIQNISKSHDIPFPTVWNILFTTICSFLAVLVFWEKSDFVMIVGSFGAQAVLIFATPNVPLAQPWNCIFGNSIGAVIGVSCYKLFKAFVDDIEEWLWIASALAVSVAIVVMLLTKSLHPPAGATALIAVQGSQRIHDLGYYYVLFPAVIASALHVAIGIAMNNVSKEPVRSYPVIIFPFRLSDYISPRGFERTKAIETSHHTHPQASSCNIPENASQFDDDNDIELAPTIEVVEIQNQSISEQSVPPQKIFM